MSGLAPRVAALLGEHLGALGEVTRVAGGSINEAFRVATASGPVFVKTHRRPPRTDTGVAFFAAEAHGLATLAPHLPVPRVLALFEDALVLEWVEPARRTTASEEAAGHALARLHKVSAATFGLEQDNFMGALPQDNRGPSEPTTFSNFFRERRLEPLAHHLPAPLRDAVHRLDLDSLLTEPSAPTLIHGDLWAGNLIHGAGGPVFIDPAVSFGHPEQDLAMTRLFGGFSEAFYAAYREGTGLTFDAALDSRLDVLTLYPLLVHVALFGGHYLDEVAALLARHGRHGRDPR